MAAAVPLLVGAVTTTFVPALSTGIAGVFGLAAATTLTNVLAGAIVGAATSAMMGGDPLSGALFGGLGGAASGMLGGAEEAAGAAAGAEAAPAGMGAVDFNLPVNETLNAATDVIPAMSADSILTESISAPAGFEGASQGDFWGLGANEFQADIKDTATQGLGKERTLDMGAKEPDKLFGSDWIKDAHDTGDKGGLFSNIFGEDGLINAESIGSGLAGLNEKDTALRRIEGYNEGQMERQIQEQENRYKGVTKGSRPDWLEKLIKNNPRAVRLSAVYTGHPGYATSYATA